MHKCYFENKSYKEKLEELMLIFENNDYNYYKNFMSSKRVKAHSGAFYSVILALKPFLPAGYYASDAQIKANFLYFFKKNFNLFMRPFIYELEKEKQQFLNNQKG
ncbi:TPA: hypothetical protein ACPORJ_000518 [Haemophilus influenzae]|uniref:hypothetical protein n=1 Tax=Haemophilus influenzae TaxID=727 RepID=UPI000CFF4218|nr:hypothetical protein [Haemophilus influenzae]MCK8883855.1 hypothetical protein [Haemophilus influenzae]PRI45995.1 hypothetical protein BVZ71_01492 [Haemophilus influenzae]PRM36365.1 hypothetical protein BVZ73_01541 [Haemophilus influenzae]